MCMCTLISVISFKVKFKLKVNELLFKIYYQDKLLSFTSAVQNRHKLQTTAAPTLAGNYNDITNDDLQTGITVLWKLPLAVLHCGRFEMCFEVSCET